MKEEQTALAVSDESGLGVLPYGVDVTNYVVLARYDGGITERKFFLEQGGAIIALCGRSGIPFQILSETLFR